MEIDEAILLARVGLLERLVRALVKEQFIDTPDPVAAVDAYANRFTEVIESHMTKSGPATQEDTVRLILSEQINDFFDLLKRDVLETLANRRP